MELRLVTPATADLVTLAEAKAHLRILHDDDDDYISALCETVRDHLTGENGWLGVSVLPQTWELTFSRFPCYDVEWPPAWQPMQTARPRSAVPLPRPPLVSVIGVFYTPSSGVEEEITDFRTYGTAIQAGAYLMPARNKNWPTTDDEPGSVRIRYTAGYATLPKAIKHAALLLIGHWYENREAATEAKMNDLPMAVSALLAPYRNFFS
jgi:uncharacterized phiE125 gp8 family phage protein